MRVRCERQGALIGIALSGVWVCALLAVPIGECSAEVLFSDSFDFATIDTEKWVIHGAPFICDTGGGVCIWSAERFDEGLETVQSFHVPAADGECICFSGVCWRSYITPASVSVVSLGEWWGEPQMLAQEIEFTTPGFDETHVFYNICAGGYQLEHVEIGAFDYSLPICWRLCFDAGGTPRVYLRPLNGEWQPPYTGEPLFGRTVVLSLTGAGGGWGKWDDIEVATEPDAPVDRTSWSRIKGLFR